MPCSPGSRRRAVGIALGATLLPVLLSACGSGGTRIIEAYGAPDSTRLELAIDACGAESTSVDLEEGDDEVVLTVTTEGGEGPECTDALVVDLDEPLGGRRLVDGSTGDALDVLPPGA